MKEKYLTITDVAPVVVEWQDHQVLASSWIRADADESMFTQLAMCVSVGWPVTITKEYVCIAMSIGPTDGQVGEVLQIMRPAIKHVHKLASGKRVM